MNARKSQAGWTNFGVIGTIISAFVGFFCFEFLLNLIPNDFKPVAPWAIVSVLLLPFGLCIQLLLKLWDLKEQDNISRQERRRLGIIIKGKKNRIYFAIGYYLLSAIVVVTLFIFLANDIEHFKLVVKITGAVLAISLFSVFLSLIEMDEISNFKAKIRQRNINKKQQKTALNRLNANKEIN